MIIYAVIGNKSSGSLSPEISSLDLARRTTRYPCSVYSCNFLQIWLSGEIINSGAPRTYVPAPSKETADNFLLDEKGRILFAFNIFCAGKALINAFAVSFCSLNEAIKSPTTTL